MKGTPAIYLGRIIDKNHFRTYVYAPNGEQRLVESWGEFESAMESGIWFATLDDAKESVAPIEVKSKPKSKSKRKPKSVKVEETDEYDGEILPDELDEMVFEVKD